MRSNVKVTGGRSYGWKPGGETILDPFKHTLYSERRKCCLWKGDIARSFNCIPSVRRICILLTVSCVYCTWQSNGSQHTIKPDIDRESRLLPIPHLHSTAALKGEGWFQPEYCHNVWYGKPRMMATGWWKIVGYVCSFRQNTRTWQTDRWTETMRRDSPHLCRTSLGKNGAWKTHSPGIVFPGNVLSAKRNPGHYPPGHYPPPRTKAPRTKSPPKFDRTKAPPDKSPA